MGLFGKPKTHKIVGAFNYVPIRDPRKKKIKTEDLIPTMPGGARTGDEFLQKYLYLVRNHMSRDLVTEWFQVCALQKDSYVECIAEDFEEDDFLGYMVQGFAMAVSEFEVFGITKNDQMADCVWGAMKSFSIQILLESDREAQRVGLSAFLSGYHLAREILKINLKKDFSEEKLFTSSLHELPKLKPKPRVRKSADDKTLNVKEDAEYLRELGVDALTGRTVTVKSGHFVPYVSDGLTNATLRRGEVKEEVSLQRASELLASRREWEASAN